MADELQRHAERMRQLLSNLDALLERAQEILRCDTLTPSPK